MAVHFIYSLLYLRCFSAPHRQLSVACLQLLLLLLLFLGPQHATKIGETWWNWWRSAVTSSLPQHCPWTHCSTLRLQLSHKTHPTTQLFTFTSKWYTIARNWVNLKEKHKQVQINWIRKNIYIKIIYIKFILKMYVLKLISVVQYCKLQYWSDTK